jgi:hypothetical protein
MSARHLTTDGKLRRAEDRVLETAYEHEALNNVFQRVQRESGPFSDGAAAACRDAVAALKRRRRAEAHLKRLRRTM